MIRFFLIGTTYDGNGKNSFGLPNLNGRLPRGCSNKVQLGTQAGYDYYIGMISMLADNYAPKEGWLPCNGQKLTINDNAALYSLLGTKYDSDGKVNFALPNLKNRYPLALKKNMKAP